MPSDSQLLTDILAELKAIRKALESKPAQAPGASPGTGTLDDPVIPFGRTKGKRMSEVGQSDWEYFAKMPLKLRNDGTPWPPDLQNAARKRLGLPLYNAKGELPADDAGGQWEQAGPAENIPARPAAAQDHVDDDVPF
jgi:hypothetical protein